MSGFFYTPLTKKALALSFAVHQFQRDKSGLPYVFHPFHLAEQMDTEEEICTALLHDVVEDSAYTLEDLRAMGFPEAVLEALALLTHDDATPYLDYVARLRSNPIARKVKRTESGWRNTVWPQNSCRGAPRGRPPFQKPKERGIRYPKPDPAFLLRRNGFTCAWPWSAG